MHESRQPRKLGGRASAFLGALALAGCATAPEENFAHRREQAERAFHLHEDVSVPVASREINEANHSSIVRIRVGNRLHEIFTTDDRHGRVLSIRTCAVDSEEIGASPTCMFRNGYWINDEGADGRVDWSTTQMGIAGYQSSQFHRPTDSDWNQRAWQELYNRQLDVVTEHMNTRGEERPRV